MYLEFGEFLSQFTQPGDGFLPFRRCCQVIFANSADVKRDILRLGWCGRYWFKWEVNLGKNLKLRSGKTMANRLLPSKSHESQGVEIFPFDWQGKEGGGTSF